MNPPLRVDPIVYKSRCVQVVLPTTPTTSTLLATRVSNRRHCQAHQSSKFSTTPSKMFHPTKFFVVALLLVLPMTYAVSEVPENNEASHIETDALEALYQAGEIELPTLERASCIFACKRACKRSCRKSCNVIKNPKKKRDCKNKCNIRCPKRCRNQCNK